MAVHSVKHYDMVGEDVATHQQSVGTGPWELYDARVGDYRKARAVRDHWRKTPEWEEMIWWEISQASTAIANLLTGKIDAGQFTLESIQTIRNENNPEFK